MATENIADEAHKLGRKVAAQAHGTQSIKDAIRAGIDSIEHSSLIDDQGIALARQHGTCLVFDIYNDDFILQQGAEGRHARRVRREGKEARAVTAREFPQSLQAGAKIAFGTDAGVYPHGDNARQFATKMEWGMKPLDSIQAATLKAADLMGWHEKVGSLEKGRYADLIAVEGDPLSDVKTLQHVKFVMKGGAIARNDFLK